MTIHLVPENALIPKYSIGYYETVIRACFPIALYTQRKYLPGFDYLFPLIE